MSWYGGTNGWQTRAPGTRPLFQSTTQMPGQGGVTTASTVYRPRPAGNSGCG